MVISVHSTKFSFPKLLQVSRSRASEDNLQKLTRPLFDSIQAAFFLLSVTRAPPMVAEIVVGGICRSPGPKVRVFFFPVGVGKASLGISSPGRTMVIAAAI